MEIKRATVVFKECTSFDGGSMGIFLNGNLVKTATSASDFPYTITCDIGDVIGTDAVGMHGYDFNGISYFKSVAGNKIENTVTQYDNIVSDIKVTGCCVPYYSQILYSDLTTKNAENVKVGDKLLGYNEQTNAFEEVEVLHVMKRYRVELCKVTFEDKSFIELTPDHPILTDCGWCVYDAEKYTNYSQYVDLNTLEVGMKVLKADGTMHSVQDITFIQLDEAMTVYTFDTSNTVNTFIAENCVVHNAVPVC